VSRPTSYAVTVDPSRQRRPDPLRVSLIFAVPLPATTGGAERWFANLATALSSRADVRVQYVTDASSSELPPGSRALPAWTPPGRHGWRLSVARGLRRAVAEADVVHVAHYGTVATHQAAALARRRAATFVTDLGASGAALGRRLRLTNLFDGFLDISEFAASRSPTGRTQVIYAGVDAQFLVPRPGRRDDFALFVGRLLPHKGVDWLIDSLPHGRRLIVAGRPSDGAPGYLDLLRSKAAGKDVTFLLRPSDADLVDLYARARVAVLPSVWVDVHGRRHGVPELFGLTLAEAMASGTPVVSSDVGSLPEVVRDGETGLVVPAGDRTALTAALETYFVDAARADEDGARGRTDVLERFTWERVADRCVEAYEEVRRVRGLAALPVAGAPAITSR
jgi:glycosyltransferase involved in cell wall biosynthesis